MESNCQNVISLIIEGCDSRHSCYQQIQTVKSFSEKGGLFPWRHLDRKANHVADTLDKFGLSI